MSSNSTTDGQLTIDELNLLRAKNVIEQDEIALRFGDLYIAENVITRERRRLVAVAAFLNESRRVLNG